MKDKNNKYEEYLLCDSKESFKAIFDTYYYSLVVFSYHFVKDKEIAEDIVQSLFCELWIRRVEVKIESSLKNYLFRSIRNKTLNFIKYDTRFVRGEGYNLIVDELHSVDPEDIDELEIQVINELNKLTKREREVFLLCYKEGYSYQEIADQLDISKNSVKTLLLRSKKTLKGILLLFMVLQ